MKDELAVLRFIWNHPLNSSAKVASMLRFIRWQLASRLLKRPVIFPFVNQTRLIAARGAPCGPGNFYVGLLEYEEMAFVMHYLRPADLFFDIGANIGIYTVLAGGAVGARCVSIEPIPNTFDRLLDNINLNRIGCRVKALNIGIANERKHLTFTKQYDSINHVVLVDDNPMTTVKVEVRGLDDISSEYGFPEIIKIDVEGFESQVVDGGERTFGGAHAANAVLMELRGHGARYGFNEEAVHTKLLAHGYNPYVYNPKTRVLVEWCRKRAGRLGDMIYIKDILRAKDRLNGSPGYSVHGQVV